MSTVVIKVKEMSKLAKCYNALALVDEANIVIAERSAVETKRIARNATVSQLYCFIL